MNIKYGMLLTALGVAALTGCQALKDMQAKYEADQARMQAASRVYGDAFGYLKDRESFEKGGSELLAAEYKTNFLTWKNLRGPIQSDDLISYNLLNGEASYHTKVCVIVAALEFDCLARAFRSNTPVTEDMVSMIDDLQQFGPADRIWGDQRGTGFFCNGENAYDLMGAPQGAVWPTEFIDQYVSGCVGAATTSNQLALITQFAEKIGSGNHMNRFGERIKDVHTQVADRMRQIEADKNLARIQKGDLTINQADLEKGAYTPSFIQVAFEKKNEQIALEVCKAFPQEVPAVAVFLAHGMEKCADWLLANGRTIDGNVCIYLDAARRLRAEKRDEFYTQIKACGTDEKKLNDAGNGLIQSITGDYDQMAAALSSNLDERFAIMDAPRRKYMEARLSTPEFNILLAAIKYGDLAFLQRHLDELKNLDTKFGGLTAVEHALVAGKSEVTDFLVKNGAKNPRSLYVIAAMPDMKENQKVIAWLVAHCITEQMAFDQVIESGKLVLAKEMHAQNPGLKPGRKFDEYFTGSSSKAGLAEAKYLRECGLPFTNEPRHYSAFDKILYRAWDFNANQRANGDPDFRRLMDVAKYLVAEGADVNFDLGRFLKKISPDSEGELQALAKKYALVPRAIESEATSWGMNKADVVKLINDLEGISNDKNFIAESSFNMAIDENNGVGIVGQVNGREQIREKYAYQVIRDAWEKLGKVKYVSDRKVPALYVVAVILQDYDLCDLMLKKGAKVPCIQVRDGKEYNAIDEADKAGNQRIVRLLRVAERNLAQ